MANIMGCSSYLLYFMLFIVLLWYCKVINGAILSQEASNTSIPTLKPSSLPTYESTLTPVNIACPSLVPSSNPSGKPISSLPTSFPSMQTVLPTQQPTKLPLYPTSSPSSSPSLSAKASSPSSSPSLSAKEPSVKPNCSPSSIPSSKPLSVLTSIPSSVSTSLPSSSPSSFPISCPSSVPSSIPSSYPTVVPSSVPSSSPSLRPTTMPTPPGQLGKNWWIFVTAEAVICAEPDFHVYTHKVVQAAVQSAFEFLLTDSLDGSELQSITIVTTSMQQPYDKVDDYYYSGNGFNATVGQSLAFKIEAWCSSTIASQSAHQSLTFTQTHPRALIEPLHERELKEVAEATIIDINTSITTTPPPTNPILSPVRIVYIIIGTILAFAVAFLMFKSCCFLHFNDIKPWQWCRNCSQNCYESCSELLFYFRQNTNSATGFSLAAQEDSLDRAEEANNGTGELSIHYRATQQQRRRYLDEDNGSSSFDETSPRTSSRSGNGGLHGIEMQRAYTDTTEQRLEDGKNSSTRNIIHS